MVEYCNREYLLAYAFSFFWQRAGASERGGLSRGLAQADLGPGVLGPEPCLGRLRAVGVFDDSRYICVHCPALYVCVIVYRI
jgi:hypothetical protein